jgi:hypothetical protein
LKLLKVYSRPKFLFILAFHDVFILFVMATCQSQPFSTVSTVIETVWWSYIPESRKKKPQSKKNSTVIDRKFDLLSITVEFSASGFFFRGTFTGKICPDSEFIQGYSNKFSTAVDRL